MSGAFAEREFLGRRAFLRASALWGGAVAVGGLSGRAFAAGTLDVPVIDVEKVHAIMGGFHLGPAPKNYLAQVVGEIRKLQPDVLIPMHCSGQNFIDEAKLQMPANLLLSTTGSHIVFGA